MLARYFATSSIAEYCSCVTQVTGVLSTTDTLQLETLCMIWLEVTQFNASQFFPLGLHKMCHLKV
jgi:hypothetical protein